MEKSDGDRTEPMPPRLNDTSLMLDVSMRISASDLLALPAVGAPRLLGKESPRTRLDHTSAPPFDTKEGDGSWERCILNHNKHIDCSLSMSTSCPLRCAKRDVQQRRDSARTSQNACSSHRTGVGVVPVRLVDDHSDG